MTAPALELKGIVRRYGAVAANDGVDLTVAAGSVHALIGENGAGKSTLMNIAYGLVRADAGDIRIGGAAVDRARHSPRGAIARGVGMVHQHFMLVGDLRVVDNLVLGREPVRHGLLDVDAACGQLAALAEAHHLAVDPRARVDTLSVGEQQRVEILQILWQGASLLILDEPTAVLTPGEVRELLATLRALATAGKTVIIITHKLDEVLAVADHVTVMRAGKVVADRPATGLDADQLAHAMIGRLPAHPERSAREAGAESKDDVLRVDDLWVTGARGVPAVRGATLAVRSGEIVGIAGVEGNGQTELIEAIAGLRRAHRGTITVHGTIGHVPEDRLGRGLIPAMTLADNALLGRQRELADRLGLDAARIAAHARRLIEQADVRPADPSALAAALSGGNQQKLVVARELDRPGLRLLLAAQPTRGVDVGAIEAIHRRILDARAAGLAVLLSSADLSELRALADRVLVMYRGAIAATLTTAELAAPDAWDRIGEHMAGLTRAAAP
jgi:general nucleoside transport system ATP-binding protein